MSGEIAAIPAGYADWLTDIKARVVAARQRAVLAANAELIQLYWQIGRDILERQAKQGWVSEVIDRLTSDQREAFPEMKGFSGRNLKYMRAFAEGWPEAEIVQRPAALLRALRDSLVTSLPTVEQLKSELGDIKDVSSRELGGEE